MARDIQATVQQAIGQRYAIERQLGRGGGAYVFLARDPGGRTVALKVLRPELLTGVAADRFLREIRLAGQLQHPHIAPLLDSGEAGWVIYYTMAYVEGPSLAHRLAQAGPLPIDEVLRVAGDVLAALEYAHGQGVVHRDVKPDNVILSPAGAVLLDFGIARAIETTAAEQLTRSGMTLGTSTYMSPEQVQGSRSLDATTDLYALGCVLFECLAGRPPFAHSNEMVVLRQHLLEPPPDVRTLRREVPAALGGAILRAMAKQPGDRWPSAAAMWAAMQAA
ncbi:MAG TPA: serine/threonine-protein kinase [Gemmatimonadales bacterium]|nr:serine/threonine-protein kinase [Gemmatimonadales bacterium]